MSIALKAFIELLKLLAVGAAFIGTIHAIIWFCTITPAWVSVAVFVGFITFCIYMIIYSNMKQEEIRKARWAE